MTIRNAEASDWQIRILTARKATNEKLMKIAQAQGCNADQLVIRYINEGIERDLVAIEQE